MEAEGDRETSERAPLYRIMRGAMTRSPPLARCSFLLEEGKRPKKGVSFVAHPPPGKLGKQEKIAAIE